MPGSTRVALVTQSFADAYLKGPAIGAHFTVPDDRGKSGLDYEVIGIISDQKYLDIREANPKIMSRRRRRAPTRRG